MNTNINMHALDPSQLSGMVSMSGSLGPSNAIMQSGVSPLMQTSPQSTCLGHMQHNIQAEKIDNISKIKSLMGPMKEALLLSYRGAAFTLQTNNSIDNLKRDVSTILVRFDKHLEDFFGYCDLVELHLKTAIKCMQQLSLAQHYLPGVVSSIRTDLCTQDSSSGPMSYPTYLNTVRVHVQLAKDVRDTLISASQNISQAD